MRIRRLCFKVADCKYVATTLIDFVADIFETQGMCKGSEGGRHLMEESWEKYQKQERALLDVWTKFNDKAYNEMKRYLPDPAGLGVTYKILFKRAARRCPQMRISVMF